MWTTEQRAPQKVSKPDERRGYPTDISDKEWKLVEPLLPGAARTGPPRKTALREVINALRYLVRSGREWRMLPNDFPQRNVIVAARHRMYQATQSRYPACRHSERDHVVSNALKEQHTQQIDAATNLKFTLARL